MNRVSLHTKKITERKVHLIMTAKYPMRYSYVKTSQKWNLGIFDLISHTPSLSHWLVALRASRFRKCAKIAEGKNDEDIRWQLLTHFSHLIRETLPDIVSMENVLGLRDTFVYKEFLRTLRECGYYSEKEDGYAVECADYGVPQKRKRLVVLASRHGKIKLLPPPFAKFSRTVKQAISCMEGKTANDDPAHICYNLSEKNVLRIKQSKPGGSWRDWEKILISPCHGVRGYNFPSSYGRMQWNNPAPTITTQFCYYSCGRFGHPEKNRAITVREAALLQSFKSEYILFDTREKHHPKIKDLARHIGNAVPPELGKFIGKSIIKHLQEIEGNQS